MTETLEKLQTDKTFDIQLPKDNLPKFSKQIDFYIDLESFPEEETDTSVPKEEDSKQIIKQLIKDIRLESKRNSSQDDNFRQKIQKS